MSFPITQAFTLTIPSIQRKRTEIVPISGAIFDSSSYFNILECYKIVKDDKGVTVSEENMFVHYVPVQRLLTPDSGDLFIPSYTDTSLLTNGYVIMIDEYTYKFTDDVQADTNISYQVTGYIADYASCDSVGLVNTDGNNIKFPFYDPAINCLNVQGLNNIDVTSKKDPAVYNHNINAVLGYDSTNNGFYKPWNTSNDETTWIDMNYSVMPYSMNNLNPTTEKQNVLWSTLPSYSAINVYKWVSSTSYPTNAPSILYNRERKYLYNCNTWKMRTSDNGELSYLSSGSVSIWLESNNVSSDPIRFALSDGAIDDLNLSTGMRISLIDKEIDPITSQYTFKDLTTRGCLMIESTTANSIIGSSKDFTPVYATNSYISNLSIVSTNNFNDNIGNIKFSSSQSTTADTNSEELLYQVTAIISPSGLSETVVINPKLKYTNNGDVYKLDFSSLGFSFIGNLNNSLASAWQEPYITDTSIDISLYYDISPMMNSVPLIDKYYNALTNDYRVNYTILPSYDILNVTTPLNVMIQNISTIETANDMTVVMTYDKIDYFINTNVGKYNIDISVNDGSFVGEYVINEYNNTLILSELLSATIILDNIQVGQSYTIRGITFTITLNNILNVNLPGTTEIKFNVYKHIVFDYNGQSIEGGLGSINVLPGIGRIGLFDINDEWQLGNAYTFDLLQSIETYSVCYTNSDGLFSEIQKGNIGQTEVISDIMTINATAVVACNFNCVNSVTTNAVQSKLLAEAFGSPDHDVSIKSAGYGYIVYPFDDIVLPTTNDINDYCWIGYKIPTAMQVKSDKKYPNNKWQFCKTDYPANEINDVTSFMTEIATDYNSSTACFDSTWHTWNECPKVTFNKKLCFDSYNIDNINAVLDQEFFIDDLHNYALLDTKYISLYINGQSVRHTVNVNKRTINVNEAVKLPNQSVAYITAIISEYIPSQTELSQSAEDIAVTTLWTYGSKFAYSEIVDTNTNRVTSYYSYWQKIGTIKEPAYYAAISTAIKELTLYDGLSSGITVYSNPKGSLSLATSVLPDIDNRYIFNNSKYSKLIMKNTLLASSSSKTKLVVTMAKSSSNSVKQNYAEWTAFDRDNNGAKVPYDIFEFMINTFLSVNVKGQQLPLPELISFDLKNNTNTSYGFDEGKLMIDSYVAKSILLDVLKSNTEAIIFDDRNIADPTILASIIYAEDVVYARKVLYALYSSLSTSLINLIFFNMYDEMMLNKYNTRTHVMKSAIFNIKQLDS